MQWNRRSFLTLTGLGAVGVAAGACGSNTGREGGTSLAQWYHAYGEDGVQEAVRRYAAEYPGGAEVEVSWNPGDYDSKIVTALQNSAVPDVFEAQVKIDWVRRNQVVPLDDLIDGVRDDFSPAVLAAQTVEGKVYGIPQATDTQVLFYRSSLLQAAGVQPPQTVDELVDAAAKLTRDGVKGLFAGNDGGVGVLTGPLLWSAGLDYLKDNREVGFDDPRAATALGKLRTLNANGSLLIGAPADWSDPGALIDGLAAMQWTGLWNVPKIQAALGDDFGILPFPGLDAGGAPSVPVGAYGAMVNAKSAHVEEAKAFVKWLWLDQVDRQLEFATGFGFHLPSRQSLVARATGLAAGPAAEAADYVRDHGHLVGGPVWTQQSNTALSDAVARIAKEGADPVAQTRTAVEVAKAELKRLFG
ncbi:ABC transporter substrate-binding protein [Amycolatopsis magusensis]|uniref:Multiple sugar transport system substrate-binding protein n=1 Tax=Amycolatopsis magusensis TaxID=882444 RepID=A0ABS4Q204_9PSEU|nr:sugar ABC transporter substrate-binding protein [Amycolatopsis magusensis]MBP2185712.1 multiple sugar transport system substrate-binding protein [Amycolatopsis magusensis]